MPEQTVESIGWKNLCGFASLIQVINYNILDKIKESQELTNAEKIYLAELANVLDYDEKLFGEAQLIKLHEKFNAKELQIICAPALKVAHAKLIEGISDITTPFDHALGIVMGKRLAGQASRDRDVDSLDEYEEFFKDIVIDESVIKSYQKIREQKGLCVVNGESFIKYLHKYSLDLYKEIKQKFCHKLSQSDNNYMAKELDVLFIAEQFGFNVQLYKKDEHVPRSDEQILSGKTIKLNISDFHWTASQVDPPAGLVVKDEVCVGYSNPEKIIMAAKELSAKQNKLYFEISEKYSEHKNSSLFSQGLCSQPLFLYNTAKAEEKLLEIDNNKLDSKSKEQHESELDEFLKAKVQEAEQNVEKYKMQTCKFLDVKV